MFEKRKERQEHPEIKYARRIFKHKMLISNGNLYPLRRETYKFILPEKFQFTREDSTKRNAEIYVEFLAGGLSHKFLIMKHGIPAQIEQVDFSNPKNPF